MPPVSVIIVTYNALEVVRKCLPSVVLSGYPNLEIILADNASTDGTAEWVQIHHPEVRIVRHPENWAFCRGNNAALPHASGEIVVLLNNDVETPPGWLEPLVERFVADERIGAAGPKLLGYVDRSRFEYAGAAGGFLDRHGYPFTRGRIFDTLEEDRGQYDDPRDVFWVSGAAIMLRRSALDRVGLLDERFVMHMEEIDLCWRLRRAGYRVVSEPGSVVYHIGGASLPQGNPRKTYLNFRNSLLMLYKNLPDAEWKKVFRERLPLDGLAAFRALASGRPGEAAAILRAYRDAHHMAPSYDAVRPRPGDPTVFPAYRGSVVADYFLRGRRRFSDLPEALFR